MNKKLFNNLGLRSENTEILQPVRLRQPEERKHNQHSEILRYKLKKALSESAKKILVSQKSENSKTEYDQLLESMTNMRDTYLHQDWRKSLLFMEHILLGNKFHSFYKREKEFKNNAYRYEQVLMYNKMKVCIVCMEWRDYEKFRLSLEDFEPIMESVKIQHKSNQLLLKSVILVGNWLLDWNETGILIPKRLTNELSSKMMIGAKMYTLTKESDETMLIVSQVVDEFNLTMEYTKDKNSQFFNSTLMNRLGLIVPIYTSGKSFVTRKLKENSFFEMCYECDDVEFMNKFGLKRKHFFSCHKEFDHFVNQKILRVDPQFAENHQEDYELFIEFERIYHFRHQEKNGETFEGSNKCPFRHLN